MGQLPKANKSLGQHFLTDTKTIEKITSDFADQAEVIIEVGPGPGVLTKLLATKGKPLYLIEKDTRFCEDLKQFTPHIINGDALEINWQDFLQSLNSKKIWLVSNLPYNVGTPLFVNFLQFKEIKYMTLMFQKEVGEKTYLRDTKNSTNGLLTLSSIYFDSKILKKVAPGSFSPPPKVDSIVVSYTRKQESIFSLEEFKEINKYCRWLFGNRRKQIGSVLKQFLCAEQLANFKSEFPDLKTLRAESLSLEQVYDIMRHLLRN